MKYTLLSIAALLLSNLAPAPVLAQPEQRAINISIFGIGPAVDENALRAVKSVIGRAVAEGVIDTYVTYGYGIEGGMSSCIQLSPFQDSQKLIQLKSQLLQIRPPSSTTSYVVQVAAACDPKPPSTSISVE